MLPCWRNWRVMASYQIEWKESARKELRKLQRQVIRRLIAAVEGLGREPRPMGCRKLVGTEHTYRLRVGEYRVIYSIEDGRLVVEVIRVGHRSSVYNG